VEYDDGLTACSDVGLVIRRYGAFLRPKNVPYAEIRRVTQVGLRGIAFGRWRIWGSTDLRHWFNFDRHRSNPRRQDEIPAARPDLPMTWSAGDTIPLGPNRTLQVLRVRDNNKLGRPADDEALF
jgi:hypothetical protein